MTDAIHHIDPALFFFAIGYLIGLLTSAIFFIASWRAVRPAKEKDPYHPDRLHIARKIHTARSILKT
jgi:hypothetical protein